MWLGGQRHTPAALPPGRTCYQLYRRMVGHQDQSGRVRKLSSPTRIRSPNRPARSQSLYRLSYSGTILCIYQCYWYPMCNYSHIGVTSRRQLLWFWQDYPFTCSREPKNRCFNIENPKICFVLLLQIEHICSKAKPSLLCKGRLGLYLVGKAIGSWNWPVASI